MKDPSKKRGASDTASPDAKRRKSAYELDSEPQTPQAIEASLALPRASVEEDEISRTVIVTNRAPLVLAFAVALLRHTMPEQPLSSRLSMAQAAVSVNSRGKAVSLGITSGKSAEEDGWGHGQPKVRVMGREIHVLKRGGYDWNPADVAALKEDEQEIKQKVVDDASEETMHMVKREDGDTTPNLILQPADEKPQWSTSQSVTLKQSTFVARSIAIKSPDQARVALRQLLATNKELRDASHNITAWRVQGDYGGILEECNDDGESGGGRHILQVMQSSGVTGVLLVVTRWYGGIMLGTDRWRLMSQVARDALSQRLRVTGIIGQEALWALDLEAMKASNGPVTGGNAGGMPIYKAESARAYILKAFPSAATDDVKKKTAAAISKEKEHNLGLLLGALDMLYRSWVEHISRDELDRRAWSWYVQVRPEVESGVAGWGGKGEVKLADILALRRKG